MAIELPDLVQRIRVKTDQVRAAEKAVTRLGSKFDDLRAQSADTTDGIDELTDSVDRFNDSTTRTTRSTSDISRALDILRQSSDRTSGSLSSVGSGTDEVSASARTATGDIEDLGDAAEKAADEVENLGDQSSKTSTDQDRLGRSTRKSSNTMGGFIKKVLGASAALKAIKFGFIVVAIQAIAGAVAQLGSLLISGAAGATALVSALGPVAGALAVIPAGILAIKSTTFAFGQLTAGVSDAVKAINTYGPASKEAAEAVKTLSGENRKLAETYAQVRFQFNDIVKAGRQKFLPSATESLNLLRGLLPKVKDEFVDLSDALGDITLKGARMVTSGPFSKDIQTILGRNTDLIRTLGNVGLKLVNVLRNIMVAAGPMVQTFADLALKGARWLDTFVAGARESGRLSSFFENTVTVVRRLLHTVIDFGAGLFNILKGGSDLGNDLLVTLRRNARQFLEWTKSVGGKNAIADFFNDARAPLAQFGRLTTALFKSFFRLQDEVPVAGLLKQLRTQLLPVLEQLLIRTGKSGLTSSIIDLATAFGNLLNALPINPLTELISAAAKLTNALVSLGKAHPIILQVIGGLLAMRLAFKAIRGFSKFTGITALVGALREIGPAGKAGAKGIKGFIQGLRGATGDALTLSNKIGKGIRSGISKGVSGVKKGLKPFGATIRNGLSAAGKGAAKAGKSIGTAFTKGLSASKGAISKAAKATGNTLKAGLSASARGAKAAGTVVAKGFMSGLSLIKGAATGAVSVLGTAFRALIPIVTAAAGAVKAFTLALLTNPIFLIITAIVALGAALVFAYQKSETFRKIVDATFGFIANVVKTAVTFVVNFVKNNWKNILTLIAGPMGLIVRLIVSNWDKIKAVFSVAVEFIKNVIGRYFTIYRAIISTAWTVIRKVFSAALGFIRGLVSRYFAIYRAIFVTAFNVIKKVVSVAWNIIKGIFGAAVGVIRTIVVNAVSFIVQTWQRIKLIWTIVQAVFGRVVDIIREKVDAAVGFVTGIKDKILGFFSAAGDWLYGIGRAIIQGLINGLKSMFGPLESTFNWITDKIPDWKGPIGKDEVLLYGAGRAIMSGLNKGIREGSNEVQDTLNGITRQIGATKVRTPGVDISDIRGAVQGASSPGLTSPQSEKVKAASAAKRIQARLFREAQKAAEKENRLRAKLPLLSGEDKREARRRIKELQAEQARLLKRAGATKDVTDLRQQRQAALRRADDLAKRANKLRSQLPDLEGDARKRVLEQIARLDEQRKAEIAKARDIQTDLIEAFRDLPTAVRKLIREAQRKAEEKRRKERRDEKDKGDRTGLSGGSSGRSGPSGVASDPVFTSLTPKPYDPEKAFKGEKGERKDAARTGRKIGKGIGDLVRDVLGKRDHAKITDRAARHVGERVTRGTNKVAGQSVKSARVFSEAMTNAQRKADQQRREAREDARAARETLRDLKEQNKADSKAQRAQYNTVSLKDRSTYRTLNGKVVTEVDGSAKDQIQATYTQTEQLVAAMQVALARGRPVPSGGTRSPGGSQPDYSRTVTVNINGDVHDHKGRGESVERQIVRRLRENDVMGRPV